MSKKRNVYSIVLAAVLNAIGILIPLTFPKISLPPASFTLASHVPIFIAVFISPAVAVAVCIGTTVGFVFSGLPFPIWMRAGSHIVFAITGAVMLKKNPSILKKPSSTVMLALLLSVIHAICEVLVIMPLYFGDALQEGFYQSGFVTSVVLLVGAGTVIHSCIDFALATGIWKALGKVMRVPPVSD